MSEAAIEFECPSCQKVTRVPASYGGRKGKCPKCGFVLEVPKPEAEIDLGPAPKRGRGSDAGALAEDGAAEDQKPCRFCGEKISKKASKCRHCGEWLDGKVRAARDQATSDSGGPPIVLRIWGVIIIGFAVLNLLAVATSGQPTGIVGTVVGIRIGLGVYRGERQAIGCLTAMTAAALLAGLAFLGGALGRGPEGTVLGVAALFAAFVIYGPPCVVGILNWNKLT
jgi:predicted RNA-binding Zn-ribbon protein involved in translation (DUF1610 family)